MGRFQSGESKLGQQFKHKGNDRIGIVDRLNKSNPMEIAGYNEIFDLKICATKPQFGNDQPQEHDEITFDGKEYRAISIEVDEMHFTMMCQEIQ